MRRGAVSPWTRFTRRETEPLVTAGLPHIVIFKILLIIDFFSTSIYSRRYAAINKPLLAWHINKNSG